MNMKHMKHIITLSLILVFASNGFTQPRIINGNNVTSLTYPWMVELVDLNADIREYFCGGALIASEWVITAAHCLERLPCFGPLNSDGIEIVVGSYDLSLPQQRVKVSEIIKHPDYDCNTFDSDIALLKLETPVDFPTLKINFSEPSAGVEAVTMGWGTTDPEGEPVFLDILQDIRMDIVSNTECENAYSDYVVTTNMICAGAEGKGTCFNDSGGPLIVKKGEWFLAGITSWGWDECAVSGYPDVFTRVSQFTGFLKEHIPDIYLLRYDYNSDKNIGLQDAVYVIRSIAVENSGRDISDAIEILQVVAGIK